MGGKLYLKGDNNRKFCEVGRNRRNFMKTFGRRMQARRREVHNPKDVGKLDCMNLAEPQVLTAEEEIYFRCYDQKGARLANVFVAPGRNRVCLLARGCSASRSAGVGEGGSVTELCSDVKRTRPQRNREMKHWCDFRSSNGVVSCAVGRGHITGGRSIAFVHRSGRNPGERSDSDGGAFFYGLENDVVESVSQGVRPKRQRLLQLRGSCGGTHSWRMKLLASRQSSSHRKSRGGEKGEAHVCRRSGRCEAEVMTRRRAVWQWWLRLSGSGQSVESFERCSNREGVEDAVVATWYRCEDAGLRARKVGGARVCGPLRSPGYGRNRRSRASRTMSCFVFSRGEQGFEDCKVVDLGEGCVAGGIQHFAVDQGLRLVKKDSRLVGLRGKCLQSCVLGMLQGSRWQRAKERFVRSCRNNDGSGMSGTAREAKNFLVVEKALKEEESFVWVFESASRLAIEGGHVAGPWKLGYGAGTCVGFCAWLNDERHVVRLACQVEGSSDAYLMEGSKRLPPWFRYIVGAPKKNRRGANFQKGAAQHVSARWSKNSANESTTAAGSVCTDAGEAEIRRESTISCGDSNLVEDFGNTKVASGSGTYKSGGASEYGPCS